MLRITHAQVWVHDQDEALAYFTEKVGFELREDVTLPELGDFRWLSVGPPSQPELHLVLMLVPGPPVFEADTAEKVKEIVAKGAATGIFFATDDLRATYEELKGRGVEFTEEPTERPYGIDCAFRDPSGNNFRIIQTTEAA
jgi:catechol 2,3-dioxygenase-like lactoylglutathione lyase family enzyme